MSEEPAEEAPLPQRPTTGNDEIDRALAGLDLSGEPEEHPARIAAALDAVQRALTGPHVPDALRPRP